MRDLRSTRHILILSPNSTSRRCHSKFFIERKTRRDRMRAKLKAIKEELRRRMHEPIPKQGAWLRQVVRGFFAYHAVPTN